MRNNQMSGVSTFTNPPLTTLDLLSCKSMCSRLFHCLFSLCFTLVSKSLCSHTVITLLATHPVNCTTHCAQSSICKSLFEGASVIKLQHIYDPPQAWSTNSDLLSFQKVP